MVPPTRANFEQAKVKDQIGGEPTGALEASGDRNAGKSIRHHDSWLLEAKSLTPSAAVAGPARGMR
jgi:hypothetical protein